jgi:uncharacterized protein YxjI
MAAGIIRTPVDKKHGKSFRDKPVDYMEEYDIIDADGKTKRVKKPVTYRSVHSDLEIYREEKNEDGSLKGKSYQFRGRQFIAQCKDDIEYLEKHGAFNMTFFREKYPQYILDDFHRNSQNTISGMNVYDKENVVNDYVKRTI